MLDLVNIAGIENGSHLSASGQPSAVDITNNGAVLWGEQTVLLVDVKFG